MCGCTEKMLTPGGTPRSRRRAVRAVTAAARMWKRISSSVDPLVHEMGRTEDDGAIDVAAVKQLASDEQGLDRLSYSDVVRDEEAHRVELERHEQRDELVRARLHRDLADAPEGARPPSQREQQRVAKQQRRVVPAELLARSAGGTGPREPARSRAEGESASDPRPTP